MSLAVSGCRFAARPDAVLQSILPQWIGCQRVAYNAKVSEDRLFAAQRRMLLRDDPTLEIKTPLDQQYAHFKDTELTPWLFSVPSVVLRNGAYRWRTAKQRQLQKLAKAPRLRNRTNFDSVLLTRELFRFIEIAPQQHGKHVTRHVIEIGTAAKPLGRIAFSARAPYEVPAMLTVRRDGAGRWWASFSYTMPADLQPKDVIRTPEELAYEFNGHADTVLHEMLLGLDRNLKDNLFADSEGEFYNLKELHQSRIARKERGARKQQRRLARQQKGSKNREKTKCRIAKKKGYGRNVRNEFAHQKSHQLAASDQYYLFAVEDLRIGNLKARPKAKQDPTTGKWLRNGAKRKAGLNKKIAAAPWGLTVRYLAYKAAKRNKLLIQVPPHHTSQECCRCGHIHPDNRRGSRFVCQSCGWANHADRNAACVIKQRAIQLLRSGVLEKTKPTKRTGFRKKNEGADSAGLSVEPTVRPLPALCGTKKAHGVEAETVSLG